MEKYDKNYCRIELIEFAKVINNSFEKPIIVSTKYKHNYNDVWATFTTVRPYIPSVKTVTLCSHINIKRLSENKWYQLSEVYHNRKFYIIGNPYTYEHYGVERGALQLADDICGKPLIFVEDFVPNDTMVNMCYIYDVDKYRR